MSMRKLLGFLLVPAYLVAMVLLILLGPEMVSEPPGLLTLLNTVFAGLIPCAVAVLAARAYLRSGLSSLLLLGAGMLVFGLGTTVAGWLIGTPGGSNVTVTIHNTCACLAAALFLLGATLKFREPGPVRWRGDVRVILVAVYGGLLALVAVMTFLAMHGQTPPFFLPGLGPTPLRQVVLGSATLGYLLAGALFLDGYRQRRSDFLYWYSLALLLIAIGLFAVFTQKAVGDPVSWLGRSAQYVGCVLALVAVLAAVREANVRGLALDQVLAGFFRDAEANYRTLVETANDAIISFDQDYRIILWNSAAERLFGYTCEVATGASWWDLAFPADHAAIIRAQFEALLSEAPAARHRGTGEVEAQRGGGARFPVEFSLAARRGPAGSSGRAAGAGWTGTCILRDITERRRAEAALLQSSRRLQMLHAIDQAILAASSPAGPAQVALAQIGQCVPCERASIVTCDPDGIGTTVRAVFAATGAPDEPGAGGGTGLAEVAAQRLGPGTRVPLADFAATAALRQGQVGLIQDLQTPGDLSPTLQTLHDAGLRTVLNVPLLVEGKLIGVLNLAAGRPGAFSPEQIGIAGEVADTLAVAIEQARLRGEIERHTHELEQRVAERTAELRASNHQAQAAAQRLQAVNSELATFTYSVSHDLKAPLRGIDGYSRLLLEDYAERLDDDGRVFLHNIRRATGQMSQLIDDLLAYSRLERRALVLSVVSPRELAEALLAERAADIASRNVQVTVDVPAGTISIEAEGLAQALRNLLDNALKFTRDVANPCIAIGGAVTPAVWQLWVRDNGVGFDMQYGERIFEIFQRLHRSEDYPGTGIGLAIVRKAVQRMGGRAWADGRPGQGASFYLEVPHEPAAADAANPVG
jgi:PAS domain S-box-containing protein